MRQRKQRKAHKNEKCAKVETKEKQRSKLFSSCNVRQRNNLNRGDEDTEVCSQTRITTCKLKALREGCERQLPIKHGRRSETEKDQAKDRCKKTILDGWLEGSEKS